MPEWPPADRALTLDCLILRMIPDFHGQGGFCPILRIYGPDPLMPHDQTPKVLFSTPKSSNLVRFNSQVIVPFLVMQFNWICTPSVAFSISIVNATALYV
jgi:hypothetical protein